MQIKLFEDSAPTAAPPAPEPEPVVSVFAAERPDDLEDADTAAWAEMAAQPGWAAMARIPSLAPLVDEVGLAVAYTDRNLMAAGLTAHEARMRSGPGLMVPALDGASPWAAARRVLDEGAS